MAAEDETRLAIGRLLLGARIRRWRTEAGCQLAEFAERAGIAQAYLSDIERGNRLAPLPTLDLIAAAFGTTVAGLLDGIYPWGSTRSPTELPTPVPDGRAGRQVRRVSNRPD